jgi:hypothetical protein
MGSQVKILLDKQHRAESPIVSLRFGRFLLCLLQLCIVWWVNSALVDHFSASLHGVLLLDEPGEIIVAALVAVDLDTRFGDSFPNLLRIARVVVLDLRFHSLILLLLLLTRIICFYRGVIKATSVFTDLP